MRFLLLLAAAASLLFGCFPEPENAPFPEPPNVECPRTMDFNGNGAVDLGDLVEASRAWSNYATAFTKFDINCNGQMDLEDWTAIQHAADPNKKERSR